MNYNSILTGSNNTISPQNGKYNLILTGAQNFITSGGSEDSASSNNLIGAGSNCGITGSYNVITGGLNNNISNSSPGSNNYHFIGAGANNRIISTTNTSNNIFIGAGSNNVSSALNSAIVGGESNSVSTIDSFIGGGSNNLISTNATYSVIVGGRGNTAIGGANVFIGGGQSNSISNQYSTIVGGQVNTIETSYGFIGGGQSNSITSSGLAGTDYSVITGGQNNTITNANNLNNNHNFIGGGFSNQIGSGGQPNNQNSNNVIVGGANNGIGALTNSAQNYYNFIGGGQSNVIQQNYQAWSVINGGFGNSIIGGGGPENVYSVINGGVSNIITNVNTCVISGGAQNSINSGASGCFIGGGLSNNISNNVLYSTIPGGIGLILSQSNSCAVGAYNFNGTFNTSGYGFTGSGVLSTISVNSDRVFMVGNGTATASRSNAFSVTRDGYAIARTGFIVNATADFGEYLESNYILNGAPSKIPVGTTLVVDNTGKVMPSDTPGLETKEVIGAISTTACLAANCALEEWSGKYLKQNGIPLYDEVQEYVQELQYTQISDGVKTPIYDTFNIIDLSGEVAGTRKIHRSLQVPEYEKEYIFTDISETFVEEEIDYVNNEIKLVEKVRVRKEPVYQTFQIVDESGNLIETQTEHQSIPIKPKKKYVQKLNPNYDPTLAYIPRPDRPEWNLVGLVGQVIIKDGQRTNPNWCKIKQLENNYSLWLIK
jgi:hypothetical protein